MEVVTFSEARTRLKDVMDRAIADREPVVIARPGGESVVLMALADWNELETMRHLLSSPSNRAALQRSIAQLENGEGRERQLIRQ